jgi:hypothetical protein
MLFYTDTMKFARQVEELLKNRYILVVSIVISLIGVLFSPQRLTDQSYEIVHAGTKWVNGSILYVQSWSSHSPQTLYLGYLYGRYIKSSFGQLLFELAMWTLLSLVIFFVAQQLFSKTLVQRNALLLVSSALVFVPRLWQRGVTDQKFALLFFAIFILFYLLWKKSGKTIWLLGATSKNWRYILLSGIALSLLLYTSWLYALLAVPVLIDFVWYKNWQPGQLISWGSFLVIPFLLESWVWLSHLSSHRLLSIHTQAEILGIRASGRLGESFSLVLPAVIILTVLLMQILRLVRGDQLKHSRALWLWALISLIVCAIWPQWIIGNAIVSIPLLVYIFKKQSVPPYVLAGLAIVVIVLSMPLRLLNSRETRLQAAQADLAIAYIEQRLIESRAVIYYGRGAGFFDRSDFINPTRYNDLSILAYDNSHVQLEPSFRGDAEAETPMFAVIATSSELQAPATPRLDQYFSKHYDKVADLDGYQILKRK